MSPPSGNPARAATDGAAFKRAKELSRAIESIPDTRADAVARARRLIGDANYPAADAIQRIAGLLAIHLEDEPDKAQS